MQELSALEIQRAIFKIEIDTPENYFTLKGMGSVFDLSLEQILV